MNRWRVKYLALIFCAGLAWAEETDAEIIQDLDFFTNFDVIREESVLEDSPAAEELGSELRSSAGTASQGDES